MNRKKTTKKMVFEPKAPVQKIEEVKPNENPITVDIQTVKGKFPPIQLQSTVSSYKYNPSENVIINIPYDSDKVDFLIFEDDTCGLRIDGKIIGLDAIEVDKDSVMNFENGECSKICDVKYYLVPKEIIKE